jgi:sec-independent protein translocase protein TatA
MVHMPSLPMMVIIAVFGVLLFGKRLPEVGRSLGKGIVEFKKGLKGIDDEVDDAAARQASRTLPAEEQPKQVAAAPQYKFDPYTGKPIEEATVAPAQSH